MRDTWYRDPRLGLAAGAVAALVVGIAAGSAGQPGWRTLLLALAGFALVAWGWFAIQGIGWLWQRPDRGEVLRALTLQRSQHGFNHAAWARFDRDAAMLRMLLAERALLPIEAELVRHAMAVERFDAVAATLPDFSQAAAGARRCTPPTGIAARPMPSCRPICPGARNPAGARWRAGPFRTTR